MTLSAYLPPLFAATIVVGLLMAFWLLWVLFLAVMHLNDAKRAGTLRGFALYAGYTVLAMGLLVDFVVQMTAATILWLEWPRELTVSGRVTRLLVSGWGYRYKVARWFQRTLLSPFDASGGHGP